MSQSSVVAYENFKATLQADGAELLDGEWMGNKVRYLVKCKEGHKFYIRPDKAATNKSLCNQCFRERNGQEALREFQDFLKALNAELLETRWLGSNTPHHIRCPEGHDVHVRPSQVYFRQGICHICGHRQAATTRSKQAEQEFRSTLEAMDAELQSEWLGSRQRHRVICSAGHECNPRPYRVQQGGGICRRCSSWGDPDSTQQEFQRRVELFGAEILDTDWLGVQKPYKVRCREGHICYPYPASIQQGRGICGKCAGRTWDVLYLVTDADGYLKLGITSGNPKPRLKDHSNQGFCTTVKLYTNLPDGVARKTEKQMLENLKQAGVEPISGREYFPPEALTMILEMLDGEFASDLRLEGEREHA
jgi:hypothetical protein